MISEGYGKSATIRDASFLFLHRNMMNCQPMHHPQHCPSDGRKSSPDQPLNHALSLPLSHMLSLAPSHMLRLCQMISLPLNQMIRLLLYQTLSTFPNHLLRMSQNQIPNNSPQRKVKAYSLLATSDKHK